MNISKHEQRVLHELALGGSIHYERRDNGKIRDITCFTRQGHILTDCTYEVFRRLRKGRFVHSSKGQPYRLSRLGGSVVRAQLNQR
ncbi:YjhX family toxin [Sedimentitalea sp.]|uniref:YjhX family toxin n=1 Tax=Sedimentitalea sp. TaxID=2048915 RepID=UPI003296F31D